MPLASGSITCAECCLDLPRVVAMNRILSCPGRYSSLQPLVCMWCACGKGSRAPAMETGRTYASLCPPMSVCKYVRVANGLPNHPYSGMYSTPNQFYIDVHMYIHTGSTFQLSPKPSTIPPDTHERAPSHAAVFSLSAVFSQCEGGYVPHFVPCTWMTSKPRP